MENLVHLLEKGLSVELRCRDEGVLAQEDVLTLQCCVKVLVE